MENTTIKTDINETTNLNGTVNIEVNGMEQQVLNMSCQLAENSVANIQTYVTNQELFLANSQEVATEVQKFRERATEVGKALKCFVF
ncbi:MAG: hypothetical protein ACRC1T_11980 [Clostridium chrysemydis]|uniref:hypothetical protein n=1 Tax=Clostridium chrysemydis TaxID=2665504 RepID=UPI003F31BCB5